MCVLRGSQLWREVSNFEELKRLETAYVVKLHNFVQLAKEKPCFTFHHPNPGVGGETHNKRHAKVEFDVEQVQPLIKPSYALVGFIQQCTAGVGLYVLLDVIAGRRVGADKLQHTLRVYIFEVVITPRAYVVLVDTT